MTGFNLVAFNAPELSGDTEYSLDYAVEMTLSAEFSGQASFQGDYIREYVLEALPMSGEAQFVGDFVRELRISSTLSGEARIDAAASKYHVDYIEFEDNFNPGDQIIIDSGKFKITRNGQNVSHLYTGDFLQLNPGT
ncbi:phage tail family protein, partial [Paenibacillus xylanilyticus]|nr:hypothetical protein [Paenibacillus xylanilyticus]